MSDSQEARMLSIEQRLLSIEKDMSGSANSSEIEKALGAYQLQVLGKLKAIRSKILEEGGDVGTIKRERDDALAENALLKKEMEKQNYRIQHLIKALNAAEQRNR